MKYILHKMFGWEYACFEFGFGHVIRRIRTAKDGGKYALCCGYLVEEGTKGWRQLL